jgi:hypothetical protein
VDLCRFFVRFFVGGLSPSEQLHEQFNRETGIGDYAAEGAGADLFVVGDDDAGKRRIAAQDHVTAALAAEDESGSFQGSSHFTAGEVGGELGHVPMFPRLRGLDFDELLAGLGGDGIAGVAAVFHVNFDSLADVAQSFIAVVTLTDAPGQRRHAGNVSAIFFLFQNDGVTHDGSPVRS